MLKCENLCKTYGNGLNKIIVLNNCNLQLHEGEAVGLMGSSGCGKSTLAKAILRLLNVDSGSIYFQNQDITNKTGKDLHAFRKQVQFISQRPESFFDPIVKLGKSLKEPQRIMQVKWSEDDIADVLEQVKLGTAILERYPHQVSGGEIQRLSIARALLLRPKMLILDEPTSMLDISVQAQILHLLKDIRQKQQLSYLCIGHDRRVLSFLCDDILTMQQGRIATV